MWLIRRPVVKRLQHAGLRLVPESKRPAALENLRRQNRFARRHGVTLLRWSVMAFFASIAITLAFQATLWLVDAGILTPPDSAVGR